MATHTIRTTFQPGVEKTVGEVEYQYLLREGLIYDGTPPDPVADFWDGILADKVTNGEAFPEALADAAADTSSPFGSGLRAAYGLPERIRAAKTGVLAAALDDATGLTANNGGSVVTYADDTEYRGGCLKLTAPVNSYTQVSLDLTADLDGAFLTYRIKPLDGNFSRCAVSLSLGDTSFGSRAETSGIPYAAVTLPGQWSQIAVPLATLSYNGSPVTGSTRFDVRAIQFEPHATSGGPTDVLIADVRVHPYPWGSSPSRGAVCMIFDDGHASQYTEAFRIMQSFGMVGSVAIAPTLVDTAGYCTLAQLQEMQTAGWENTGHGTAQMAGQTLAQVRTALRDSYDYLTDNNMPASRGMWIYPGGSWDAQSDAEVRRTRSAARLATSQSTEAPFAGNIYRLRPYYFTNTLTVADVTAYLDKLKALGGLSIMTFHRLVATSADKTQAEDFLVSDFQAVAQYIHDQSIPTFTPSQVYDLTAR